MVTGLLVIDLIILIVWQVLDPLQRKLESFPLEDPVSLNDDIKIRPQLEHCESVNNSVWLSMFGNYTIRPRLAVVLNIFWLYHLTFCRSYIRLQRFDSGVRFVSCLRDALD